MKYGFFALLIGAVSGAYAWAYDAGRPELTTQIAASEAAPTATPIPAAAPAEAAPSAPATPPAADVATPVVSPVSASVDAAPAPAPAVVPEAPVNGSAVAENAEAVPAETPVVLEPLPEPRAPEEDYVLTADLLAHDGLKVGSATKLTIKMSFPNQRNVKARDLLLIHGRPLHVYAVDESLTDYQHLQPKAGKAGKWYVKFTPRKSGSYRLFVDAAPIKGKRQLMPLVLEQAADVQDAIDKSVTSKVESDGYNYALTFDEPLKADSETTGHITITDKYGRPITDLEPMMGSFAYVVGVSDDLETITQTQPKGSAPKKRSERGGPDIDFAIEPKRIGHMKLFVHTRVGGKDRVVAMGVDVAQ